MAWTLVLGTMLWSFRRLLDAPSGRSPASAPADDPTLRDRVLPPS